MKLSIIAVALIARISVEAAQISEISPEAVDAKQDGTLVVEYYRPECSSCADFEPTWTKLVEKYQDQVSLNRLNCATHTSYCQEKGIVRFPTIQSNINGGDWKEFTGELTYPNVDRFIQENHMPKNLEGTSIELKRSAQLEAMIESKEPWFIKFYAPWCGHCKNLQPVWIDMARRLKGKVNVAEVNCEDNRAICQDYKVTGLPTLSYYVHGASLKYNGPRELEKLVDYAIKMSGSPVHKVENETKLKELLKESDVSLVYVTGQQDDGDLHVLEKAAPQFMETVPFYTTSDPKVASHFGLKTSQLPAAIIVKDNDHIVYDGDISQIANWVHQERHPLLTRIMPHNSNSILKGQDLVVLGITQSHDAPYEDKMRNLARKFKEQKKKTEEVVFAQLDGKKYGNFIARVYNIQSNKLPTLIVLDPKNEMYYNRLQDNVPFSLDKPEKILKSLAHLNKLPGISTAPSKTMGLLEKIVIFFGDHWIMMSSVLLGFAGLLFWLVTSEEPEIKREQIREIGQKEAKERLEKENQSVKLD
ncbi:hypothetical protein BD560DRAFT_354777 [Blakeslea trispora]|nr:hypothetical protein BD560DRAFT_354777 [Blakeslea trispora]